MVSRCIALFESSIKTEATLKSFTYNLKIFLNFVKHTPDSFLNLKKKEIESLITDYVMHQKKRVQYGEMSANSIGDKVGAVFKFLKANGKKIDREMITQHFPDKVKRGGERAITDDEVRKILSFADVRERALVHAVSCTGCRPEALSELKMKYVEEYQDGFTKITFYANDFKHEYITFLSPEATDALNEYLEWRMRNGEKITEDSYFFSTFHVHNSKKPTIMTLHNTMHRLMKKAGITRIKTGNRYDLATYGGFRKRFITKLGLIPEISENTIQILVDHTGYLSGHYRKPTEEQIFNEYKKAVSSLALSREYQLKQKLDESEKENIEQKDKRIASLEATVSKLELMLMELSKKI